LASRRESIVSLYKAFNASCERGFVPLRKECYKTLSEEAAEFSNRQRLDILEPKLSRIEVLVERLCQKQENDATMPQNRLKTPLKTTLDAKRTHTHTKKPKKGTRK